MALGLFSDPVFALDPLREQSSFNGVFRLVDLECRDLHESDLERPTRLLRWEIPSFPYQQHANDVHRN